MRVIVLYLFFLLIPIVNIPKTAEITSLEIVNADVYTLMNLEGFGLNRDAFELALKGLNKLAADGRLNNPDLVTIADYSQSSNKKRFYVIDLKNNRLLFNTYVAHGRNTGDEYARLFSNQVGSFKSSLGFYITENPINGSHTGMSLIINGVEQGINNNALKREIIIHGADYATEDFITKSGRLGRSFGCPALPPDLNKPIIETIKGGTCLFIYNPDNQYLQASSLLK